jgi:hypothetical protein
MFMQRHTLQTSNPYIYQVNLLGSWHPLCLSYKPEKPKLQGKAQYSGPPCTNHFDQLIFTFLLQKYQFLFLQNKIP